MPLDFQTQLHAWQSFYMLCGAAAATLAGLLFVGLTFGSGLFAKAKDPEKLIHIWAEPILQDFLKVLLISALALVPVLSAAWFAAILLAASLRKAWHLGEVGLHLRGMGPASDLEASDWALQLWLPALACLLELAAAAGLLLGQAWAFVALGACVFIFLGVGIQNTWTQLVWMAVEREKPHKKK
jgi:hypothetical protein